LESLFNKQVTYWIFKNKINKFELDHDCSGLWKSLNFVKFSKVRREVKRLGLALDYDRTMITQLFDRLENDIEFRKRHKIIYFFSGVLRKTGLIQIFRSRFAQNFSPYMKLTIRP
jgi:hypothetical protein